MPARLASGAEARWTNEPRTLAAVLVNGGRAAELPGTWSASLEWLVGRLAPRLRDVGFLEVRYRVRSWNRLDACAEDAAAAVELAAAGAARVVLVGFSMGGAVATLVAGHPSVTAVVGLAPWLPERLDLSPLRGRRLAVLHGALDRALPGMPGVRPQLSRGAVERARALGVEAEHTLIAGAGHALAVRAPWGVQPLPRARRWAELVERELALLR